MSVSWVHKLAAAAIPGASKGERLTAAFLLLTLCWSSMKPYDIWIASSAVPQWAGWVISQQKLMSFTVDTLQCSASELLTFHRVISLYPPSCR